MTHRRIPASGLLLALLALTAQLAFGAVMPRPEVALMLQSIGAICHAPSPAGTPAQPTDHHNTPGTPPCPFCAAVATPAIVLPGTGITLVPPPVAAFHSPGLPPSAAAPPTGVLLSAQPRGPPILA